MSLGQNASTLGGLEGSSLARIAYSSYIITQGWANSILQYVVNANWDSEITRCNQQVQFSVDPDVGQWRNYEKSQVLQPDEISPNSECLYVRQMRYKAVGFDDVDIMRLCERATDFQARIVEMINRSLFRMWECYAFIGMVGEAAASNKGANAGRNCNLNLGTGAAPVEVNRYNIADIFAIARQVLLEQRRWHDGEMFAIISPSVETLALLSPQLQRVNELGVAGPSQLLTGRLVYGEIMGFDIFVSDVLQPTRSSGAVVDTIIFGWRDAYAFAGELVKAEIAPNPFTFAEVWRMLSIFDGKAIMPNALVVAQVTVDLSITP